MSVENITPNDEIVDNIVPFPLASSSEIIPFPQPVRFPETAQFISTLPPEKAEVLSVAVSDQMLIQKLEGVKRKLLSEQLEYGDDEFWGQVNQVTSHIFEVAAHHHVQQELQAINPDLFVSSPYYTKMMYGIDNVNKKLSGKAWTEADFFIFERRDTDTAFVGAGEITGELNLGDKASEPYISSHKFKQLAHYQSGKVVHDVFKNQPADTQRKMGRFVEGIFPDAGLADHLVFETEQYFSVIALPDEPDIPPGNIDTVIRVPLDSNDSYYTALSIIHEFTYSQDEQDTELPLPSAHPTVIPLPSHPTDSGAHIAAGD